MRIHLETQRLKNRLVNTINASGLPTMCVRVVVDDLARQLRDQEATALRMEAEAEDEELRDQEATALRMEAEAEDEELRALKEEKQTDTPKEASTNG